MIIFSIDPGLSGAWAVIDEGRATTCGDLPVSGEGSGKRVAAAVLRSHLNEHHPHLAVVEQVSAMPASLHGRSQGTASTFRFGMAFGACLAVPAVLGIPVETVVPAVWKRRFGLIGKDKEASRQKALDLCPGLADQLRRKLDHGRAEAILIGLYAAETWGRA